MKTKELLLRFLLGGASVSLSYIASVWIPWKALGGMFAAFPAVMIAAVFMVGVTQGSEKASAIAKGSVYGMAGCAICVLAVLFILQATGDWWLSLGIGVIAWFVSAVAMLKLRVTIQSRVKNRT
ncbi:DUF3147 family protein [Paenibacillus nanensis]|uniref:DUF3147 family protein n=1 Tax=Paenibacillus nanensis TaxID=393251 RepID=A0A3A1UPI2_9BACL|nr:DUF3147 family protein [Paenibacillus nanensis]RIX50477.1 DUF3147 family protein [Paenibacillus nanensis]